MKDELKFTETLQEAIKYFADDERAFEYMKSLRWPSGKVACPRCGCEEVSFISTRKLWTCKKCETQKQFTIRVGTILEASPIGFDKWICAFWLIANAKNDVSSYEIHRALGVTQKTGWFMLQRIRLAMQSGNRPRPFQKGDLRHNRQAADLRATAWQWRAGSRPSGISAINAASV